MTLREKLAAWRAIEDIPGVIAAVLAGPGVSAEQPLLLPAA